MVAVDPFHCTTDFGMVQGAWAVYKSLAMKNPRADRSCREASFLRLLSQPAPTLALQALQDLADVVLYRSLGDVKRSGRFFLPNYRVGISPSSRRRLITSCAIESGTRS